MAQVQLGSGQLVNIDEKGNIISTAGPGPLGGGGTAFSGGNPINMSSEIIYGAEGKPATSDNPQSIGASGWPVINSDAIKNKSSISLPNPKVDSTNYNALVDHGQGILGAFPNPSSASASAPANSSDLTTRLNTLMASLSPAPPSVEAAYNTAYGSSGVEAAQQEARMRQAAVRSAQAELAGIQAQIQGVISKRDAQNLKLEGQASQGQVVGTVLNRQQQEVNRQTAIEALPLQALALAAQAKVASLQGESDYAQSSLKIAQDKLDTAFKLKGKDIENEYEYKKDLKKSIYDFLTAEEKIRAEKQQKKEDQQFQLDKDQINNAQAIAKSAMENGQADIAAKITLLDPKSKTYMADVAALQAQVKPKLTAQSDFEQAFLRDKGRLPTVAELLEFKKQSAEARRLPSVDTAVDNWVKLLSTGQVGIQNVPMNLRNQIVQKAEELGVPIISPTFAGKSREAVQAFNSAISMINTIDNLSQRVITAQTFLQLPKQILTRKIGAYLKTNKDAAVFQDSVQAFLSMITRAAGERGVLTTQDVTRIRGALPKITDTRPIADKKLETLRSLFESIRTGTIEAFTTPIDISDDPLKLR